MEKNIQDIREEEIIAEEKVYLRLNDLKEKVRNRKVYTGYIKIINNKKGALVAAEEEVTVKAKALTDIKGVAKAVENALNLSVMKDTIIAETKATVVDKNGTIIMSSVPLSSLYLLEERLVKMREIMGKLPVRTNKYQWESMDDIACTSEWIYKNRYRRDNGKKTKIGVIQMKKYSAELSSSKKEQLIDNVDKLIMAVKRAIRIATNAPVVIKAKKHIDLCDYLGV